MSYHAPDRELDALGAQWGALARSYERDAMVCTRCGTLFREVDNLGAWLCAQHAAFGVPPPLGDPWPCCGRRHRTVGGGGNSATGAWADGCCAADHTTLGGRFTEEHDTPVPSAVMRRLAGVQQRALVQDDAGVLADVAACGGDGKPPVVGGVAVVRRYDWRKEARLRQGALDNALPFNGAPAHWGAQVHRSAMPLLGTAAPLTARLPYGTAALVENALTHSSPLLRQN